MSVRELTGLRLSETARCLRQAAYRGLGAPEDEPPADVQLYFRRGHFFGRLRAAEYADEYGADAIQVEREIPWPGGTGHADIYVIPTRTLVEVVSTVAPTPLMLGHKIEQVKRYLHYDPEAEHAVVEHINPSRLAPVDAFPVRLTDDDRERIDAETAALLIAVAVDNASELPRVCSKPGDARQQLCPFADTCFAGWQQPEVELDSPEARQLAAEGLQLARARREAQAEAKETDEAWRDWQARAVEAGVPEGVSRIGPVVVKRTLVAGRETFRRQVAEKAGIWTTADSERFRDFLSIGQPHERWTVEQDGDGPVVTGDDFGSDAPW